MIKTAKCRLFSYFYQRDVLEIFHATLKNDSESILKLEVSIFLILGNNLTNFLRSYINIYINGDSLNFEIFTIFAKHPWLELKVAHNSFF